MSGRRGGISASALRSLTWLLSKPYACLMRLRRWVYRGGLLSARAAGVPVVSVGNITAGGTGKTPMVAWVVARLKKAGRRPAVLIRGYKAVGGRSDEAELLERLTGAPVIVNPDRLAGARAAVAGGANCLVVDDGFQHLRLRRDLDVVLVDATRAFGYGHCLPRGLLREPLTALRDADAIVITRSNLIEREELASLRLRLERLAPAASLHLAVHAAVALSGAPGEKLPVSELAGRKVCAFCGIGNPEAFFATLSSAGAEVAERVAFDDHVAYDQGVLGRIAGAAAACRAEVLVTTAKDRVKIDGAFRLAVPLWALEVEMRIVEAAEVLEASIMGALGQ